MNIKRTIKELFTASYDPRMDRIQGCEHGTLAWHHEDRHKAQFNNKKITWLNHGLSLIMHTSAFAAAIGTIMIFVLKDPLGLGLWVIAGILSIPYVAFVIMLEIDAWIYSLKMVKKRK